MSQVFALLTLIAMIALVGLLIKNASGTSTVVGSFSHAYNSALRTATFQGNSQFMTPGTGGGITGFGG